MVYSESKISERFDSQDNIPEKEDKSPIICVKYCSSVKVCCSDLIVIIYHRGMNYFKERFKEETRNERETGSMLVCEGAYSCS